MSCYLYPCPYFRLTREEKKQQKEDEKKEKERKRLEKEREKERKKRDEARSKNKLKGLKQYKVKHRLTETTISGVLDIVAVCTMYTV